MLAADVESKEVDRARLPLLVDTRDVSRRRALAHRDAARLALAPAPELADEEVVARQPAEQRHDALAVGVVVLVRRLEVDVVGEHVAGGPHNILDQMSELIWAVCMRGPAGKPVGDLDQLDADFHLAGRCLARLGQHALDRIGQRLCAGELPVLGARPIHRLIELGFVGVARLVEHVDHS